MGCRYQFTVKIVPNFSDNWKSLPDSALTESCTVLIPLANLSNTPLTSPPFLHGDDSKLILFVDPDKECFGSVVEDTTALWPVTLHTSYLQVWISSHEEEMIIDQLLSDLLVHASQWVVVTGKITRELGESSLHELFNSNTLFLGDSGRKSESLDGSSDTNSDRVYWDIRANVSLDFVNAHVGNVFEASWETVVFTDEWVKDLSKVDV